MAREIPDLLGEEKPSVEARPVTGPQNDSPSKKDSVRSRGEQPKTASPEKEALRRLIPGAMRKSLFLPDQNGYWIARWIDPEGNESPPIPLWIDREGNGHFLLQATIVLGEDQPPLIRAPRASAFQILSLFREPEGAFRPIASEVWVQLPKQGRETRYRPSGKGGWRAASALAAARDVFSPFVPALRNADDPEICSLAVYRWPDIVLVHLPANPPFSEESNEDAPQNAARE